jgi:hypothetical protein
MSFRARLKGNKLRDFPLALAVATNDEVSQLLFLGNFIKLPALGFYLRIVF